MAHAEQSLNPSYAHIRDAWKADVPTIAEIYNEAIEKTVATFACRRRTNQEMHEWYLAHDSRHPVYVLLQDQQVVGWGALSSWSLREGYRDTVELSVYLAPAARGQGFGSRMFDHLVEAAKQLGHHCLICCHTIGHYSMEKLAESRGFSKVGTFEEIAIKFNQRLGLALWQLILEPQPSQNVLGNP